MYAEIMVVHFHIINILSLNALSWAVEVDPGPGEGGDGSSSPGAPERHHKGHHNSHSRLPVGPTGSVPGRRGGSLIILIVQHECVCVCVRE